MLRVDSVHDGRFLQELEGCGGQAIGGQALDGHLHLHTNIIINIIIIIIVFILIAHPNKNKVESRRASFIQ